MSWIETIDYENSTGKLRSLYDRIKGPDNNIDNIMLAHSLRPHSMEGHMSIYKNVLHHTGNKLPKSLLEMLGVYVSMLNGCEYCVEHHFRGFRRLLKHDERVNMIRQALETEQFQNVFDKRDQAILHYAKQLTQTPSNMKESSIQALRNVGLDDGEVLEINQVVAYFAYANRTVLGLGVTTEGDILGLSPGDSENPYNWQHQ